MAHPLIDRVFYEAIVHFDDDEAAREHYYRIMDSEIAVGSRRETVRKQILRVYAMLFCDDLALEPGQLAGPDEVETTADRLYTGCMGFDPAHWYRMQHHFPIIDDDNYDRFAALVVADLSAGPLHEAAIHGGDMLLLGEPDPLHMTPVQREHQQVRAIALEGDAT